MDDAEKHPNGPPKSTSNAIFPFNGRIKLGIRQKGPKVRFRLREVVPQTPSPRTTTTDPETNDSVDGSHASRSDFTFDRPVSRDGTRLKLGAGGLGVPTLRAIPDLPLPRLPTESLAGPSNQLLPERTIASPELKLTPKRQSRPAPAFGHQATRSRLVHLIPAEPPSPETPATEPTLHPLTRHEMAILRRELGEQLRHLRPPSSAYPSDPSSLLRVLKVEHRLATGIFTELIRESTVSMRERGLLLHEVKERYGELFATVPEHLEALYSELGKLRGLVGSLNGKLEASQGAVKRAEAALASITSVPRTDGLSRDRQVLSTLAPAKETVELRMQIGEIERDRDAWVRRASALASFNPGLNELHPRAEALRSLVQAIATHSIESIAVKLEKARDAVSQLSKSAHGLQDARDRSDGSALRALRACESEIGGLVKKIEETMESATAVPGPGSGPAAVAALRDLATLVQSAASWRNRLAAAASYLSSGDESEIKRASEGLSGFKAQVDAAVSEIKAIDAAFPVSGVPDPHQTFERIARWIEQSTHRTLGSDGRSDSIRSLKTRIDETASSAEGLLRDYSQGPGPSTIAGVTAVLAARREFLGEMKNWVVELRSVTALASSGKDGKGRALEEGNAIGQAAHLLVVEATKSLRGASKSVRDACDGVWREMVGFAVGLSQGETEQAEVLDKLSDKVSWGTRKCPAGR